MDKQQQAKTVNEYLNAIRATLLPENETFSYAGEMFRMEWV